MFSKMIKLNLRYSTVYVLLFLVHLYATNQETESKINTSSCHSGLTTDGYTYPSGDIHLEEGSNLEIYCVVTNTTLLENKKDGIKSLHFDTSDKSIKKILNQHTELVNSTTIRLFLQNMPRTDKSLYYCQWPPKNVVCLNNVVVGVKPQDVQNFRCIVINYENLTCYWTAPNNNVPTNYVFKYISESRKSFSFNCPEKIGMIAGEVNMSCHWTLTSNPMYRQVQDQFPFLLDIGNKFGNKTMKFEYEHCKIVRPAPPENLTAEQNTTNSIFISWIVPTNMNSFAKDIMYRVLYQCILGPKEWKLQEVNLIENNECNNKICFNLTNLPYANDLCDIRVSLATNCSKDDENMWSANASITERTGSARPGLPPKTNIGSFQISPKNMTERKVLLYWQILPEYIQNGDKLKYIVEPIDNKFVQFIVNKTTYAEFTISNEEHKFAVWAENIIGPSLKKSYITIPALEKVPQQPSSLSKTAFVDDGKYELNWENPDDGKDSSIKSYTIFWCLHTKERPYQCEGLLNWTQVKHSDTKYETVLPEVPNKFWQFAISSNSDKYSSGMLWFECTVLNNNALSKLSDVNTTVVTSTTVEVAWQSFCTGYNEIAEYLVYYCVKSTSPEENTCKNANDERYEIIDAKNKKGIVSGLIPYTTYRLSVAVKANNGEISGRSSFLYATTLEGAPTPPRNLIISNITNSSFTVSWHKPEKTNGAIKEYILKYNNNKIEINNVTLTTYNILNLTSFKTFNVSVSACTTVCSSIVSINVTTKIGTPSQIDKPNISDHNATLMTIVWNLPKQMSGRNDFFDVRIRSDDKELVTNTTATRYSINCEENVTLTTFYVSVRAVNLDNKLNESYVGEWSDELYSYCRSSDKLQFWLILATITVLCIVIIILCKKIISYCNDMNNITLKLPPGLETIQDWDIPKTKEENERIPTAADEELLLEKIAEKRVTSGDSSGCSSGHGSVVSESGTTFSGTSDSGTEQNSTLRKRPRNITSSPIHVPSTTGYITLPDDAINKNKIKPASGSYCVIGIDPSTKEPEGSYVKAAPNKEEINSYEMSSPYIQVADISKPCNSGYVSLPQPDVSSRNPSYVIAGTQNML